LSTDSVSDLPFKLDLLRVYEMFTQLIWQLWVGKEWNLVENRVWKRVKKMWYKQHEKVPSSAGLEGAVSLQVISFEIDSHSATTDEQLVRTGITELNNEDKVRVLYYILAEYWVAD